MGFLCVTQSHTIDRPTVARNGSMDKCWKRWSGLKCILLAWKSPLKVTFCVIVVWAIPSDVKKFFYCWVGISCEYSRCNNIDQQFADARLSKTAQIGFFGFRRKLYVCWIWRRPVSKFLFDIRGNSSVLVIFFFLVWRASHVGHVTRFLSSNTLI